MSLLPTERDFDPYGDGSEEDAWGDEWTAWQNFGGLTLEEAKAKFRENRNYDEDFMWMGGRAFAFYFPVVDDFLRSVPEGNNSCETSAWFLSKCIQSQFDCSLPDVRHLAPRVIELADFVRQNIRRFGRNDTRHAEVIEAWSELAERVRAACELG